MLTVSHISKTFNPGTVNEKCAIRDLSLHLDPGDFVTIIGANGAGKSTLFNAIAGSFYTDSGSIILDGRDITFLPEYKRAKIIGRLFQDPMLGSAPGMTIEENLALAAGTGGWLSHVTRAEKEAFRDRLALLDMGLENRMKQPVGLLSGGQRQALTLMMATMADPKLLLLDEHTAALDPGTAEKVLKLTRHDYPQHAVRPGPRQPHPHDGQREYHPRYRRGRAPRSHRGRPASALQGRRRPRPRQRPHAAFLVCQGDGSLDTQKALVIC